MSAVTHKCLQCGGTLESPPYGESAQCAYCGTLHTLPKNASRPPTPEEIAQKLAEARAHVTGIMDAAVPGYRKIRTIVSVAAVLIAFVITAVALLIAAKFFSLF